jgi:hypothetical protein
MIRRLICFWSPPCSLQGKEEMDVTTKNAGSCLLLLRRGIFGFLSLLLFFFSLLLLPLLFPLAPPPPSDMINVENAAKGWAPVALTCNPSYSRSQFKAKLGK